MASQVFIERRSRRAFRRASRSIGNFPSRKSSCGTIRIVGDSTPTGRSYYFRIIIDHSARNGFVNAASTTIGISKIAARHARYSTPWSIVMPISSSTWSTESGPIVTVITVVTSVAAIVTVVTRTWIPLVIR
jgi:hypothetical protein